MHMKRARDPEGLRAIVVERDLTHRELGLLVGCSYATIGFMLAGRPLNRSFAQRIARVLRRRLDELFDDAKTSDEQDSGKREVVA